MFEQFDEEIMKRVLKRPYPVEEDLPPAFRDILRRLDRLGEDDAAMRREKTRQACN